jgi:electron transfer flavoprotein beta subunit
MSFSQLTKPSWVALFLIGMITWMTFWFDFSRKAQIDEIAEIKLPAVLTIQTGINEPKYVSLSALLEAEDKETKDLGMEEIGFDAGESVDTKIDQVFFPPIGKMAEILKGNPEEVVTQLTEILKKKKG